MSNASLRAPAETAVRQCMNLQPDESCAIVTNDKREAIGEALYEAATEITAETTLLVPRKTPCRLHCSTGGSGASYEGIAK